MPSFTVPYAPGSTFAPNFAITDLMRQQGQDAAQAALRQGAISGQMWSTLGNQIAAVPGQIQQQREQQQKIALNDFQLKAAQEAEDYKTSMNTIWKLYYSPGGLPAGVTAGLLGAGSAPAPPADGGSVATPGTGASPVPSPVPAVQGAPPGPAPTPGALLPGFTRTTDGVVMPPIDDFIKHMATSGQGAHIPEMMQTFTKAQESLATLNKTKAEAAKINQELVGLQFDAAGDVAAGAKKWLANGGDPSQVIAGAGHTLIESKAFTPAQVQPYLNRAAQDPTQVGPILDEIIELSRKQRETRATEQTAAAKTLEAAGGPSAVVQSLAAENLRKDAADLPARQAAWDAAHPEGTTTGASQAGAAPSPPTSSPSATPDTPQPVLPPDAAITSRPLPPSVAGGAPAGPPAWDTVVADTARKLGVDPALAQAVAKTESNYNPDAVSRDSNGQPIAYGIMQLTPQTAKRHNVNLNDPTDVIRGGVEELRDLLAANKGDVSTALRRYNASPQAPNAVTDGYVQKVLGAMPPQAPAGAPSDVTGTAGAPAVDSAPGSAAPPSSAAPAAVPPPLPDVRPVPLTKEAAMGQAFAQMKAMERGQKGQSTEDLEAKYLALRQREIQGFPMAPEETAFLKSMYDWKTMGTVAAAGSAEERQATALDNQTTAAENRRLADQKQKARALVVANNKDYAAARSGAENLRELVKAAQSGNMSAAALQNMATTMAELGSQGYRRMNVVELAATADAGAVWDRVMNWYGKATAGQPVDPRIQKDIGKLADIFDEAAFKKYADEHDSINNAYETTIPRFYKPPASMAPPPPKTLTPGLQGLADR